jgi:hypothetical protein
MSSWRPSNSYSVLAFQGRPSGVMIGEARGVRRGRGEEETDRPSKKTRTNERHGSDDRGEPYHDYRGKSNSDCIAFLMTRLV